MKKLQEILKQYKVSNLQLSIWQLINTFIPYFILLYLMYLSLSLSYWLTLLLSFFTAGFFIRIFIIFHDCGHQAFFTSRRSNNFLGFISGILIFIPSYYWYHNHAVHHATTGDLDRRGIGDVWTMTIDEYKKCNKWKKILYHFYRNPFILLIFGPTYYFLIANRFYHLNSNQRERLSVQITNLFIIIWICLISSIISFKSYFLIQFPVLIIAATIGTWLFYVQHQFEGVYWERHKNWTYIDQALKGSSFYKLPKILQWFTGNIGFHHIHHLSPKIPNYYLEKVHEANEIFKKIKPITFFESFKSLNFRLWDEKRKKLVSFLFLKEKK